MKKSKIWLSKLSSHNAYEVVDFDADFDSLL